MTMTNQMPPLPHHPHLYDNQMPSTSQWQMPMNAGPGPPQLPFDPLNPYAHHQFMQQQQQQMTARGNTGPGYPRSPSRAGTPNLRTQRWLNHGHLPYAGSPVPSVAPSVMSMSHMSIPDDAFSTMSLPQQYMVQQQQQQQPQLTELRPCSRVSVSSCSENIDPAAPRLPSCAGGGPPGGVPQGSTAEDQYRWLIHNMPQPRGTDVRNLVDWVERALRLARSADGQTLLAKETVEAPILRDICRVIEMWQTSFRPLFPLQEEGQYYFKRIIGALYHICFGIRNDVLAQWLEQHQHPNGPNGLTTNAFFQLIAKAISFNAVGALMFAMLLDRKAKDLPLKSRVLQLSLQLENGVLQALCECIAKSDYKSSHYCYVMESLAHLLRPFTNVTEAARHNALEYLLCGGGLPLVMNALNTSQMLIKSFEKDSGAVHLERADYVLYHSCSIIVFMINHDTKEKEKRRGRRVPTHVEQRRYANPEEQFVTLGGIQKVCDLLFNLTCSEAVRQSGFELSEKTLSEAFQVLSHVGNAQAVNSCPEESWSQPVEQVMCIMSQRRLAKRQWWERAVGFLSNMIANRPLIKRQFVMQNGFEVLSLALSNSEFYEWNRSFSDSEAAEKKRWDRENGRTMNELADNACLCFFSLVAWKGMNDDPELIARRDAAITETFMKGLLNNMLIRAPYVRRRLVKLVTLLMERCALIRDPKLLLYVTDDLPESSVHHQDNLVGCLYGLLGSLRDTGTKLHRSEQERQRNEDAWKQWRDDVYKAIQLLLSVVCTLSHDAVSHLNHLVRCSPSMLLELARLGDNTAVTVAVLTVMSELCTRQEGVAQLWSGERSHLEALASSADATIAHLAQNVVGRMGGMDFDEPMADMFSAMGGDYL